MSSDPSGLGVVDLPGGSGADLCLLHLLSARLASMAHVEKVDVVGRRMDKSPKQELVRDLPVKLKSALSSP